MIKEGSIYKLSGAVPETLVEILQVIGEYIVVYKYLPDGVLASNRPKDRFLALYERYSNERV
jgi:hypothetical protein